MTTLATRMREVSDLEGFDIVVYDSTGTPADPKKNGLPRYPHERKAKTGTSIADWKARFKKAYPAYSCDVLNGDGSVAHGNSKVENVRETYEE